MNILKISIGLGVVCAILAGVVYTRHVLQPANVVSQPTLTKPATRSQRRARPTITKPAPSKKSVWARKRYAPTYTYYPTYRQTYSTYKSILEAHMCIEHQQCTDELKGLLPKPYQQ